MVTVTATGEDFSCLVSDGIHQMQADTIAEKGGKNAGFRPHDLLAAALGSCLAIQLQMYASRHRIRLGQVSVKVEIDRSVPDRTIFKKEILIEGDDLSDSDRKRLHAVSKTCPVQNTLSKQLEFVMDTTP